MSRRLTPRHRRTLVARDVGWMAGHYEQCDHRERWVSNRSPLPTGSILIDGLVGRAGILDRHALRQLAGSARLSDFDARTIAISDLLGVVHLHSSADIVMWHRADGARVPTSIARLLRDPNSVLVLGGNDVTVAPRWSAPVVVHSSSLPGDGQLEVVALTAMTFTQFIGDVR